MPAQVLMENWLSKYIKDQDTVAVGTSRLGEKFVKQLALLSEQKNIRISFIPTSTRLAALASFFKLPIASLNEREVDVAVEFAAQADPGFNFTKSDTLSLVRDKMIAQSAASLFVVVDEKNLVTRLHGRIPCEIVPFGWQRTLNQLDQFGKAEIRKNGNEFLRTETGNYLADVEADPAFEPSDLDFQMKEIAGVIESGIFLGYADQLVIMGEKEVRIKSAIRPEGI
ncbi:MAG: ribose-5-phosphate isomerase A [Candidatus Diapherotrites archaeon]|nr:ribose-5-phosphate isomerase A [Candidatus Diapherotrites archaeon]